MDKEKNLTLASIVQAMIFITEVIGGILTGSTALLADACHMFVDLLSLLGARWASIIIKKPKTRHQTFTAYKAREFVGSLSAAALMIIVIIITGEALVKLFEATPILAKGMIIIASIGLLANIFNFFLLRRFHEDDSSIQSAVLHIIGDGLSSVIVLAAGTVIYFWNMAFIDPLLTIGLNIWLFCRGFGILKRTKPVLLEGLADSVNTDLILETLRSVDGIRSFHHVHIWPLGDKKYAITCHVILETNILEDECRIYKEASEKLKAFSICETNFQHCQGYAGECDCSC